MCAVYDWDGRVKCPHCNGTGELPTTAAHVGMMIHVARQTAGMTQEALAIKVGRSRAQIANIESGRSSFDVKMLTTFADALGVPAKELIP